jgi:hypothetical protein
LVLAIYFNHAAHHVLVVVGRLASEGPLNFIAFSAEFALLSRVSIRRTLPES